MHSAEHRAFLAAAAAWSRFKDERGVSRMLRSPLSGVPQELGAAYAALSLREGSVVELLDRQRLAAGTETREMILEFRRALRDLAQIPATASDEERLGAAAERFGIASQPPASGALRQFDGVKFALSDRKSLACVARSTAGSGMTAARTVVSSSRSGAMTAALPNSSLNIRSSFPMLPPLPPQRPISR